jgi:hypothetical protein
MRSYTLNIAGYKLRFQSSGDGPELIPSIRFLRSIIHDSEADLQINIHSGKYDLPENAERVFHAPYVEEVNGTLIKKQENFWSVWKHHSNLFIKTILPLASPGKNATLKFSLSSVEWDLWFDSNEKEVDPSEYPLDGLILYYLTVVNRDIMIHASGVNYKGHGFLFSGISGRGKSTIAMLWENAGAKVLHDDRLIVRNSAGTFTMFNTPVYNDDIPCRSSLEKIFIIEHGTENKLVEVKGAEAVSLVMANCIQHNWNPEIIEALLTTVSIMCSKIPTVRLSFKPDKTVIDKIVEYEL